MNRFYYSLPTHYKLTTKVLQTSTNLYSSTRVWLHNPEFADANKQPSGSSLEVQRLLVLLPYVAPNTGISLLLWSPHHCAHLAGLPHLGAAFWGTWPVANHCVREMVHGSKVLAEPNPGPVWTITGQVAEVNQVLSRRVCCRFHMEAIIAKAVDGLGVHFWCPCAKLATPLLS